MSIEATTDETAAAVQTILSEFQKALGDESIEVVEDRAQLSDRDVKLLFAMRKTADRLYVESGGDERWLGASQYFNRQILS